MTNKIEQEYIEIISQNAWQNIAPFWPLKNMIACNPLQGFEHLPFEEALRQGRVYFEAQNIGAEMDEVNCQTIKWCAAFFDKGQATIKMPNRHLGFYKSFLQLAKFDDKLHKNSVEKIKIIDEISNDAKTAILQCLEQLNLKKDEQENFLKLMLVSLSGWASYVKYLGKWQNEEEIYDKNEILTDYLAARLLIALLIWPQAKNLIAIYDEIEKNTKIPAIVDKIKEEEKIYQSDLVSKIKAAKQVDEKNVDAQFVFCIDVRSEPMRRAIEAKGNYKTFGFAGFFGIFAEIKNEVSEEKYASCPVLLKPRHIITEKSQNLQKEKRGFENSRVMKKLYQSLKYGYTTPFILAESIGILSGVWMAFYSFAPKTANKLKKFFNKFISKESSGKPCLGHLAFEEKLGYAFGALKTMGLTYNFAPVVVLCGHGSATENNAYATALDCGACGGNHGGGNAKILAEILNDEKIRQGLQEKGIAIPQSSKFVAAQHNTTTDYIEFYDKDLDLEKIKKDVKEAQKANSKWRLHKMDQNCDEKKSVAKVKERSATWSQTRPEWGLARNASFIVAKRGLTKNIDLDGRSFLHSYDYLQDKDGSALNLILTAPMVVAQWINNQYLFSTINNIAYGGGSKITQNIVGKIGVMQGNASDLMTGLALQSVFSSDAKPYHQPLRLTTFVNAPRAMIDEIISKNEILQKLFGNGFVHIFCLDANDNNVYHLQQNLKWQLFD
jgi:uncharacterized protein